MIKRLAYISHISPEVTLADIQAIGENSQIHNQNAGITGVLLCTSQLFFQIIEGEAHYVDRLFESILADPRHYDVVRIHTEDHVCTRQFPDWSMEVFDLEVKEQGIFIAIQMFLRHLVDIQNQLGHYVQPAVKALLKQGQTPIEQPPHSTDRIILYSNILGFSGLSEHLLPEATTELLNTYLELASQVVSAHGGLISQYMGDCLIAYFQPEAADAALQATLLLQQELAILRVRAPVNSPQSLLYSGQGLSCGSVIEGNMGSSLKMDYGILGCPVKTAIHLERLTRTFSYPILLTADVEKLTREPWGLISLGEHSLSGLHKPQEVFAPCHTQINPSTHFIHTQLQHLAKRTAERS